MAVVFRLLAARLPPAHLLHARQVDIAWTLLAWLTLGCWTLPGATAQTDAPRQKTPPSRLIVVQLSPELFAPLADRQIDKTTAVRDVILGTPVQGVARTTGRPTLTLQEDPNSAAFVVILRGANVSRTVGQNGPAIIHGRATTRFAAAKRIAFEPGKGFVAQPAQINAVTQTTTEGISSTRRRLIGRIVRRRAAREVEARRPQLNAIAKQRAESRIRAAFDGFMEQRVAKLNENVELKNSIALLLGRDGEPRLACCTRPDSVLLAAAGEGELASLKLPPVKDPAPIQLWVHNSLVGDRLSLLLKQLNHGAPGESLAEKALEVVPPMLKDTLGLAATAGQPDLPVNTIIAEDWIVIKIEPQAEQDATRVATRPRGPRAGTAPPAGLRPAPADKPARAPGGNRIWTSHDGKHRVNARLLSATSLGVLLKRADSGDEVAVPWSRLSPTDQQYARATGAARL